ncbi:dehydrogenase [Frondihabitans sucicola]|uniref:Dehydrogenase n=1 Tax=Frondihabitans sucicola TaxID=1268041 RepID=A0ABM8GU60_9MICO|nr:Gfo/Idh/MocA family oxidoreductase [Frondihabitans sucicola]BDZ51993.1 dehydrogenase [Frondihabitans sucicola]
MKDGAPTIGLIGAGGIAHAHLPGLLRIGARVVVYSPVGADDLVAQHGGEVADTLDDLLAVADFVDVATPTHTHHDIVKRAVARGKNVISEKPLARTDADARDLVESAAARGVQLYPAHVVRYFPEYVRLKEAVDAGLLGELAVLRFSRSGSFPTRTRWFGDRSLSGGIIMDQMIHDLDIARWVAGEVVRVSAVSIRRDEGAHPVEAAHVLLTHASGAISHVAGTWGPPHLRFATEYSVTGTRGTLAHSSLAEQNYTADLESPEAADGLLPPIDPAESPYYLELRDFASAFAGGPAPRVSAHDGLVAVALANAALTSLDTGQPVDLPEFPDGAVH